MSHENNADHEFVFFAHKNSSSAARSSSRAVKSGGSSSSSSSSSSLCRTPKFPHLRPIPIQIAEEDESFLNEFNPQSRVSPPPSTATCQSRMSPLPQEVLDLMPASLRLSPPSRPPPPRDYVPSPHPPPPSADYCFLDYASSLTTSQVNKPFDASGFNYDYLRELVTSDALAVLASSSSPLTSLARRSARPLSPSALGQSSAALPKTCSTASKFVKPDIITSNSVDGTETRVSPTPPSALPSPKFIRSATVDKTTNVDAQDKGKPQPIGVSPSAPFLSSFRSAKAGVTSQSKHSESITNKDGDRLLQLDNSNYVIRSGKVSHSAAPFNSTQTKFDPNSGSLSDGACPPPHIPPRRRPNTSGGSSSDASSTRSLGSYNTSTANKGSSVLPGITKLSYPLNEKYTNVVNANTSFGRVHSQPLNSKLNGPPTSTKIDYQHSSNTFESKGYPGTKLALDDRVVSAMPPPMQKLPVRYEIDGRVMNSAPTKERAVQNITVSDRNKIEKQQRSTDDLRLKAGCHPMPSVIGGEFNNMKSVVFPSVRPSSPILSKYPYRGQRCLIQPLPAPPSQNQAARTLLPASSSLSNAYDPDGIYDNIVVSSPKPYNNAPPVSLSPSSLSNSSRLPKSAPNSPLTQHNERKVELSPEFKPSHWSPPAHLKRSVSPPAFWRPPYQNQATSYQFDMAQQLRSDQNHVIKHPPHSHHHMVKAEGVSTCPTCQQPQLPSSAPVDANNGSGLMRSASCDRFPPVRPSPSSSPQLPRRGGSASPSFRHSPSPDPVVGLGKPPRPRRQIYQRSRIGGSISVPQQQQMPVICCDPNCSIPHMHHQPINVLVRPNHPQLSSPSHCCHQTLLPGLSSQSYTVMAPSYNPTYSPQQMFQRPVQHQIFEQQSSSSYLVTPSHPPNAAEVFCDVSEEGQKLKDPNAAPHTAGHKSLYRCVRSFLMPS